MVVLLSAIVSFVVLAVPLWSQPPTTFVHDNRLRLVRQAPQVYRPAFGRLDSNAGASTLDSLLQRGFDPEVDIFGYDSSIVSFAGGTFLFRRAGRTELVVRYPVYPGYLDTVGVVVSRDGEGFDVTLRHRPVVAAIDTVTQRVRLRLWLATESDGGLVELSSQNGLRFSDYDSTTIRFEGREVVPIRPGITPLTIHYPKSIDTAVVQVDSAMVVRVLPKPSRER